MNVSTCTQWADSDLLSCVSILSTDRIVQFQSRWTRCIYTTHECSVRSVIKRDWLKTKSETSCIQVHDGNTSIINHPWPCWDLPVQRVIERFFVMSIDAINIELHIRCRSAEAGQRRCRCISQWNRRTDGDSRSNQVVRCLVRRYVLLGKSKWRCRRLRHCYCRRWVHESKTCQTATAFPEGANRP